AADTASAGVAVAATPPSDTSVYPESRATC
ncbi:hypothetical protein GA0115258_112126, partial [Streptomyces sp. LamerLS-31b]